MARLLLQCEDRKPKIKKLLSAVISVLNQNQNFKAELVFMNANDMRELNFKSRGKDSVTDVLSFPSLDNIRGKVLDKKKCFSVLDGNYIFIGSIVLCEDRIFQQAKELGHSKIKERNYLIVHGLMHLFGYDHLTEKDKKQMRKKEKAVFALLKKEDNKSL